MATNDSTPRTIEIQLTKSYVAIVDEQDADLAKLSWYATVSHGNVYARRDEKIDGKRVQKWLHRIILERMTGCDLPLSVKVDHIDGNGTNCVRQNLRCATNAQNGQNQKLTSKNKSGYKGVFWEKRRNHWVCVIKSNGKSKFIGSFPTAIEAHIAYKHAALELHGEFARLQ